MALFMDGDVNSTLSFTKKALNQLVLMSYRWHASVNIGHQRCQTQNILS